MDSRRTLIARRGSQKLYAVGVVDPRNLPVDAEGYILDDTTGRRSDVGPLAVFLKWGYWEIASNVP